VHKSTALRLLQCLVGEGFARQLPDGRFTVGLALIPLAQVAMDRIDVRAAAHPHVRRLAHTSGHTVHVAQLIGDRVQYVDKVDGRESLALGSQIGIATDPHTAGVAKVIIAFLPASERAALISQMSFERFTPTTITDSEQYARQLDVVAQRGWAEDDGEKEPYIVCVALPIRDASGKIRAGLSVTALAAVTPLAALRSHVPEYRQVALAISKELGWKGPTDHDRR
jgi:DNA-binding IclR family transcriptional regulator